MSNKAIGNRFEREMSKVMAENGFWCHVMQQNKAGQPVLIDCKEMSDDRFEFYRAEENQRLAMNRFQKRGGQVCWFALKLPNNEIRMLSYFHLLRLEKKGKKSLGGDELIKNTVPLSAWLNYTKVESG